MDWFGKRSINWHVGVCLIKIEDIFQIMSHIHIFKTQQYLQWFVTLWKIVKEVWTGKNSHLVDNAGC